MFSIVGTSMAAVIGADFQEIEEILQTNFPDIDIANINTAQIVSGNRIVDKAADFFEEVHATGFAPVWARRWA